MMCDCWLCTVRHLKNAFDSKRDIVREANISTHAQCTAGEIAPLDADEQKPIVFRVQLVDRKHFARAVALNFALNVALQNRALGNGTAEAVGKQDADRKKMRQ